MQDKQPEALRLANDLDKPKIGTVVSFKDVAALLRTQHADIERKNALLRQALETWVTVCNAFGWDKDHMAAFAEIRKELSQ